MKAIGYRFGYWIGYLIGSRLPIFVRWGFYWDIPIPFTNRVIVLDAGWRRRTEDGWFRIWGLGWRYRR